LRQYLKTVPGTISTRSAAIRQDTGSDPPPSASNVTTTPGVSPVCLATTSFSSEVGARKTGSEKGRTPDEERIVEHGLEPW